jgi:hypothetical protein
VILARVSEAQWTPISNQQSEISNDFTRPIPDACLDLVFQTNPIS